MESPSDLQAKIEQRLRSMRILWVLLFMCLGVFYLFTRFTAQPTGVEPNSTLSFSLLGVALFAIPVSFVIKQKLLAQSVEKQQPELVQQAFIVACAICEVGAILGVVDHFATGNPYYFIPMIIGALGELLHFPQRQHVIDASLKSSSELQI